MINICRLLRRLFCLLLVMAAVGAQADPPTMTTISDTLYRANGVPAKGTLLISWSAFTTADNKPVTAGILSVTVGPSGQVNLALAPHAGATPAGSYYKVILKLDDNTTSTEYWSVPAASPTTISAIRTTVTPASVAIQMASREFVQGLIAAKADETSVVHRSGVETITGSKQFIVAPTVPAPVSGSDVVNKAYVDGAVVGVGSGTFVSKAGDAMTGPLTLAADPSAPSQAANRHYVDTQIATAGNSSNAVSIQNTAVDAAAPTKGQSLVHDGTKYKPQSKPQIDLRDYVVGNGTTDDTAGLQQAINAAQDYSEILCPNLRIKITSTIQIYHRVSLSFRAGQGVSSSAGTGCSINWGGPNGGTMLDIQRSRDLTFRGLTFTSRDPFTSDLGSGADVEVNLGQSISGGGITTNITFEDVSFINSSTRTTTQLVHIGDATGQNNEFMKFLRCKFTGGLGNDATNPTAMGMGVYIAHPNAKSIVFEDSAITGMNPFIRNVGGSFVAKRTAGGGSRTIYSLHGASEPILIEGDNFEGVYQVVSSDVGFGAPIIRLSNARYGDPSPGAGSTAAPYFDFQNSNSVILEDIQIDQNTMAQIIGVASNSLLTLRGGIRFRDSANLVDPGILAAGSVADLTSGIRLSAAQSSHAGAGFNFFQTTGNSARGLWMNQDTSSQLPEYGLPPCATDTLCIGDGEIEITGLRSPSGVNASVVGTPGSTQYIIGAVALDANGKRTLKSTDIVVNNAPATLDSSNYVHLSSYAVPGAASYQIVQTSSGQYRVLGTTSAATYDVQSNPTNAFDYVLPTINETARVKARVPLQLRAQSTPGVNPPSGFADVYFKSGAGLCTLDQSGNESCGGGGSSGTSNSLAKFSSGSALTNSNLSDDGTIIRALTSGSNRRFRVTGTSGWAGTLNVSVNDADDGLFVTSNGPQNGILTAGSSYNSGNGCTAKATSNHLIDMGSTPGAIFFGAKTGNMVDSTSWSNCPYSLELLSNMLGPFTDGGLNLGAASDNRFDKGYFKSEVNTPKLAGITDTNVVTNLNADLLDGKHASSFAPGGFSSVSFSATPTFDASSASAFKITLTADVTSSTLSNAAAGQNLSFVICQDAGGSHGFAWPSNVKGGMTVGTIGNKCSAQSFMSDGSNAYATASGVADQ